MESGLFLTGVELLDTTGGPPPPVIPAAQTVLVATASSPNIGLTWTNNDTYSAVLVDRKSSGDYSQLASIAGGSTSYTDTTPVIGTAYTYRVRGLKAGYPSPYSNESSATALAVFSAQGSGTSGDYLGNTSTTSGLSVIHTDNFIIGGWIKPSSSISHEGILVVRPDLDNGFDPYSIAYDPTTHLVTGETDTSLSGVASIDSTPTIAANQRAFVLFWVTQTTMNLQIDNNTVDSSAIVRTAASDPSTSIAFFDYPASATLEFKGLLDEWFFCKNPASVATAISTIQTNIYNGGTGVVYADVSANDKTTIGLVSWWGFDEASGATRKDLNSSNDLTLNGTVAQATALVAS